MDDDDVVNPAPQTEPQADPQPAADPQSQDPQTLLDGGEEPAKEPEQKEPEPVKTLLDDDDEEKDGQNDGEKKEEEQKEPDQQSVDDFKMQIKEVVKLPDGVEYDDEALNAMAAPLMELTGGDPKKADRVIKAYTDFRRKESNAQIEEQNRYAKALSEECTKRFGKDIKIFSKDAREGGFKVFGNDLWNVLRHIPQIGNNPDMIERLAMINRKLSSDPAVVQKEQQQPAGTSGWVSSMYGGIGK